MNNKNSIIQNDTFDPDFTYVYIFLLNKINSTKSQVFIKSNSDDISNLEIGEDGFYTICRVVVPKDQEKPYYYKGGKFYNQLLEVTLLELIEVNPLISELDIKYYYYFQVNNLRNCYIQYAKSILDSRISLKCDSELVSKEDIYKRDLVWSALNVINYLVEDEQYEEAERLLERITGCNGLCSNTKICHCGCGG